MEILNRVYCTKDAIIANNSGNNYADFNRKEYYSKYKNEISDIKVLHAIDSLDGFEETAFICNEFEDNYNFEIPYISIPFNYTSDRINLIEFYGDSKDFLLQCWTSNDIINAIGWIERNEYRNVYLELDTDNCYKWIEDRDLFYSIKEYIGNIVLFSKEGFLSLLEEYGYDKMVTI